MSLRARLWIVLGALVVVPLLAAGAVGTLLVSHLSGRTSEEHVQARAALAADALTQRCATLGVAARALAAEATLGAPAAAAKAAISPRTVDAVALLGSDGAVLASAGSLPAPPSQLPACTDARAAATGPAASVLAQRVAVRSPRPGGPAAAVATLRLDTPLLDTLRSLLTLKGDQERQPALTLVDAQGKVVASNAAPAVQSALAAAAVQGRQGEVAGRIVSVLPPAEGVPVYVVASELPKDLSSMEQVLAAAVVLVGALALVLGWHLARQLTGPLDELTAAAERVAGGDLAQVIPVRRDDETGRLATAFNGMTVALDRTIGELSRSRDALRESLGRLGGVLGSTHDLDALLQVVLDAAVAATGAQGGAAWSGDGGPLRLAATSGPERDWPEQVVDGFDVRGRALARAGVEADRSAGSDGDAVGAARLAVALRRGPRVVGLLELEAAPGRTLDRSAADALGALAGQASVAVDNVLLHREAQRLSTTDPLTGLWNFRYLSMSLAREIERATRFRRPLSVLMLDLDHFKAVNDTHGHPRGDAVLRELAARLTEQIREVDVLARYGGEEFVLVLPETTLEGAAVLADRICTAVRREPFGEEGEVPLRLTVSVGVAGFPDHAASAATLVRVADDALYVAKEAGRDRFHVAGTVAGRV
ncbi:MAG: diguanylate cyclase [Motilibacteraceae bacterium]